MVEEDYVSYLLRLRRTVRAGQSGWLATLEDTRTGDRVNLRLEELVTFLRNRLDAPADEEERRRR
jgi:hypothetical protein